MKPRIHQASLKTPAVNTSQTLFNRFIRTLGLTPGALLLLASLPGVAAPENAGPEMEPQTQGPALPAQAPDEQRRAKPPADALPAEVTGVVTVLHADDFEHGKSWHIYKLEDLQKKTKFNLHFDGKVPPGLQSGARIRVRGLAKDTDLYLAADGTTSVQILAPAMNVVSGEQKTLVLITDFTDAKVNCGAGAIRDLMFTDPTNRAVDDLYREMSLQQVSFSGAVAGPFPINASSSSSCNIGAWADAADAAARAASIDLSQYSRKVYVLPSTNGCGAVSGFGQVGGNPSQSWIFRCDLPDTFAHELGHNLGMGHAATPTSEYADVSDVMGFGNMGLRPINAPHREQMGWLPPEQITPITSSGIYDVAPLALDPQSAFFPQTFKITKPDTGDHYYLSYRQPIGFDASLSSGYLNRLTVHRFKNDGLARNTTLLARLSDSGSFTDTVNGISITQLSHASDRVTFKVEMKGSCAMGGPGVTLAPNSQSGIPGTQLSYTATISNTDTAACPQTTFNLAQTLPAGWSGGVSPGSLTLSPGQSAAATLTVTSPGTATSGSYGLSLSATDTSNAKHANSGIASYTVTPPCSITVPALSLSPSSQSGLPGNTLNYTVSITNRDSTACSSSTFSLTRSLPVGWSGSVSPGTTTLAPGQTSSANLSVTSPGNASSGTYSIGIAAGDSITSTHSVSASGSYAIMGDQQAPTAPVSLTARLKGKQVVIAWKAAKDNVGIAGYTVWRNGLRLGNTTNLTLTDTTVKTGTTYSYFVTAYDSAGNVSPSSNSVSVAY